MTGEMSERVKSTTIKTHQQAIAAQGCANSSSQSERFSGDSGTDSELIQACRIGIESGLWGPCSDSRTIQKYDSESETCTRKIVMASKKIESFLNH
jgi:hypothetical protein